MTKPEKQLEQAAADDAGADEEAVAERATAWFVRLSCDTASDAERRDFRAWLEADPAHRDAYVRAEALWDELAGLPDPRPAPVTMILASRRSAIGRFALLAACLLLVVAAGFWGLGGYDRLRADHATAVGETRAVTLADGSVLHLNTDSAVAVEIDSDSRRIRLYRGEAYVEVAADRRRPFDVITDEGVARAVGTAFNVRSEAAAMTVAVAEGRVEVRGTGPVAAGDSVTLEPGAALRYSADGGFAPLAVDVDALTAWREGKLVFANRPLRAVVAELDRYRPGSIVFLSDKIADERFSGVVDLADTNRALAAIESTLPVDVIHLTGYLTLLRGKE